MFLIHIHNFCNVLFWMWHKIYVVISGGIIQEAKPLTPEELLTFLQGMKKNTSPNNVGHPVISIKTSNYRYIMIYIYPRP